VSRCPMFQGCSNEQVLVGDELWLSQGSKVLWFMKWQLHLCLLRRRRRPMGTCLNQQALGTFLGVSAGTNLWQLVGNCGWGTGGVMRVTVSTYHMVPMVANALLIAHEIGCQGISFPAYPQNLWLKKLHTCILVKISLLNEQQKKMLIKMLSADLHYVQ